MKMKLKKVLQDQKTLFSPIKKIEEKEVKNSEFGNSKGFCPESNYFYMIPELVFNEKTQKMEVNVKLTKNKSESDFINGL